MDLNLNQVVEFFKTNDNFHILCHENPDGDTLGSGFALHYSLKQLGKNSAVFCNHEVPHKYKYLLDFYEHLDFEHEKVVSVDTADKCLLGDIYNKYEKIDLSIDHHLTHNQFADYKYVDCNGSSTCENMLFLILAMGVKLDSNIANCLYTGIITDTGLFKYECTTYKTHDAASILLKAGANFTKLCYLHFDRLSKEYLELETYVQSNAEYHFNNRCLIFTITTDMIQKSGIKLEELDIITDKSKKVDGVEISVTIKQKSYNVYKVSIRTNEKYKANEICQIFGGGGHIRASGCSIDGSLDEVKEKILGVIKEKLNG